MAASQKEAHAPRDNDFYLDSACSTHVTNRRDLFISYHELEKGKRPVEEFEGSIRHAQGYGHIKLKVSVPNKDGYINVTIRGVLYIPDGVNLISQGIFMENGLRIVAVNGYGMNIYSNRTLVTRALQIGRMFPFDIKWDTPAGEDLNLSLISAFKLSSQPSGGASKSGLWHRRLGHFGIESLRSLSSHVDGVPDSLKGSCERTACVKGKHSRRPSKPVTDRAKAVLELIHSDFCGRFRTPSFGGGRYMLLFIDDATRFTKVYILKYKSEAFTRFKEFKAAAEKQMGYCIKRFRIDGGGEYTSNEFAKCLRGEGIIKKQRRHTLLSQMALWSVHIER